MPHIHEQIDFTVAAYILNKGRVLLIFHKQLEKWLPIGGHIELDEDTDEGLFREIEEESGIPQEKLKVLSRKPDLGDSKTKPLYTPNFVDIHPISVTHKHIGLVYFLVSETDEIQLAEEEHEYIRWFTKEELYDTSFGVPKDVVYYAEEAMRCV